MTRPWIEEDIPIEDIIRDILADGYEGEMTENFRRAVEALVALAARAQKDLKKAKKL